MYSDRKQMGGHLGLKRREDSRKGERENKGI